jgi:hypothetical protein
LTGSQFAAQVAAVVAKEVMAIKYGNTAGHSIKKLLEA